MFFSFDISRGYVQAEKSTPFTFCAAYFCFEGLIEQEKKKYLLHWSLKQLLYQIIPFSFSVSIESGLVACIIIVLVCPVYTDIRKSEIV